MQCFHSSFIFCNTKVTSFKYLCSGIKYYSIIRKTPFGNSLTIDLAKAAIDGEQLGADELYGSRGDSGALLGGHCCRSFGQISAFN